MIYFVGAGPGAEEPDHRARSGALKRACLVVYAGSW
jgi:precorrin-4 methylase